MNENNRSTNELPNFTITMLGGSGVGKTIFMACMYVALSARGDLSIAAESNLDQELRNIYNQISNGKLPDPTFVTEAKFEFFLAVDNHQIAKISWIDYRGGALNAFTSEKDAEYLHERIKVSDAVLMMLDLSAKELKDYEVGGTKANDFLNIGRMKIILEQQNTEKKIKSVIFVRTKSDLITDASGKPDLALACDELVAQLNTNTSFRDVPVCAAIAVSSCKVIEDENQTKTVLPSDPLNTQWVLFIAVRDLLSNIKITTRNKIIRLKKTLEHTEEKKINIKRNKPSFKETLNFLKNKAKEEEDQLSKECAELASKIKYENNYLNKLDIILDIINNKIPIDQVKIFTNNLDSQFRL